MFMTGQMVNGKTLSMMGGSDDPRAEVAFGNPPVAVTCLNHPISEYYCDGLLNSVI